MRIEILDSDGNVQNTIISDEETAEAIYPGCWRMSVEQPPVNIPNTPSVVTMRQARLALLEIGKYSQVNNVISLLPSPDKEKAEIEWQYSNEVQRHNGFVSLLGPGLGLTEQDVDNLFILAASK